MTIIEKLRKIFKEQKITYMIDGNLITLYSGIFDGHFQLEKLDSEEDYTLIQRWCGREDEHSDDIYNEHYDISGDYDELEEIVINLVDDCRSLNRGVIELDKVILKVEAIKETYELPDTFVLSHISSALQ